MKNKIKFFSLILAIIMIFSMVTPILAFGNLGEIDSIMLEKELLEEDEDFMSVERNCNIHNWMSWSDWKASGEFITIIGTASTCAKVKITYTRTRSCRIQVSCNATQSESRYEEKTVSHPLGLNRCLICGYNA